jgi:hypothetical protein
MKNIPLLADSCNKQWDENAVCSHGEVLAGSSRAVCWKGIFASAVDFFLT